MTGTLLAQISSLHSAYCGLTNMDVKLNHHRTEVWKGWIAEGFEPQDLRDVVRYINAKIKEGLRKPESFKFDRLITPDRYTGFSRFEDDLSMARKIFRKRSDKPADKAVETPNGMVHYQDNDSPPARRFTLDEIGEAIKKGNQ